MGECPGLAGLLGREGRCLYGMIAKPGDGWSELGTVYSIHDADGYKAVGSCVETATALRLAGVCRWAVRHGVG